jgi:hypothetical protein
MPLERRQNSSADGSLHYQTASFMAGTVHQTRMRDSMVLFARPGMLAKIREFTTASNCYPICGLVSLSLIAVAIDRSTGRLSVRSDDAVKLGS